MSTFTSKEKSPSDISGSDVSHAAREMGGAAGNAVKNAGQKIGDTAKKAGDKAGDQISGIASTVAHKAEDAASYVGQKAGDATNFVSHKAGDAASYVGHKADDATDAVASGMKNLGSTIREKAPHEGVMGQAGKVVAEHLESGGRYLEEQGLKGISDDMTNLIKRNPIPAVLIGIGIGYLLAHATTRS